MEDAALKKIKSAAETMVQQLMEIATDPGMEAKDRIAAARDLLDRGGYSAKQKVEHSGAITTGPGSEIRDMILEERSRRRAEGSNMLES